MSFFIESAVAEGGAAQGGDPGSLVIMMVIFAAVFYFMIWRPQSKRTKEHKNLMSGLSKGDEVVTNGGMIGKVAKVSDDFVPPCSGSSPSSALGSTRPSSASKLS